MGSATALHPGSRPAAGPSRLPPALRAPELCMPSGTGQASAGQETPERPIQPQCHRQGAPEEQKCQGQPGWLHPPRSPRNLGGSQSLRAQCSHTN